MALSRNSAEGKTRLDFWQAATGAFLALFVCVHLLLEGTVVISPALTNGIAWFLEATWLTHLVAPIIILMVVFHFYIKSLVYFVYKIRFLFVLLKYHKILQEFYE